MANFTERIKIIVDVVTDGAKTGLSGFKTAVNDAETTTGKFKAGASSAFDSIKANAGSLALGAGSALVAFGIKAVGVFDDTAKHAEDMAAATGLSIEQSSRWIAIADDLGVSAEGIQGSFGKIIKGLDKTVWEDYGVATHDAAGELRDTNDIMLDAFDTLSKIPAGSARAKAGTDLFGKSYKDLSPLIGKSREEMEKWLGSVEDGQVITDEEAESAKRMRLAQDSLKDALGEVTLALGGMVAEAAPFISFLADAITKTIELKDRLDGLNFGQGGAFAVFGHIADAYTDLKERGKEVIKYGPFSTTEQQKQQDWADHLKTLVIPNINDLDIAHKNLAQGGMSDVEYQEQQNAIASAQYEQQVDTTNRAVQSDIQAMENKWDELHGHIDQEQSLIHYRQSVAETKQAMIDAGTAAKEHGVGSPEHVAAIENARLKQLGLEDETADLAQQYTDMPPEVVTDLIALIDAGSIDALPATIQAAIDRKDYRIKAHLDTIIIDGETHAAGSTKISIAGTPNPNVRAAGGPVAAGVAYTVGEKGEETFVPNVSGTILPHGAALGDTYIYNMMLPPGLSPTDVASATRRYHRRGGR